mmetsp:Transcript_11278/g.34575  ORF Transcript_11278/g.34575 Transcript_11278/m.34575 type:complete len:258 (-) Transcript_11278:815-1588(-)
MAPPPASEPRSRPVTPLLPASDPRSRLLTPVQTRSRSQAASSPRRRILLAESKRTGRARAKPPTGAKVTAAVRNRPNSSKAKVSPRRAVAAAAAAAAGVLRASCPPEYRSQETDSARSAVRRAPLGGVSRRRVTSCATRAVSVSCERASVVAAAGAWETPAAGSRTRWQWRRQQQRRRSTRRSTSSTRRRLSSSRSAQFRRVHASRPALRRAFHVASHCGQPPSRRCRSWSMCSGSVSTCSCRAAVARRSSQGRLCR